MARARADLMPEHLRSEALIALKILGSGDAAPPRTPAEITDSRSVAA